MSSVPAQTGTSLMIGFGSFAYTGYIPEDGLKWKNAVDGAEQTDENGAVVTLIASRPRVEFELDLVIKTTGGDITPPTQGDQFTITDPDGASVKPRWWGGDPVVTFARGQTKLSGTAILFPDVAADV